MTTRRHFLAALLGGGATACATGRGAPDRPAAVDMHAYPGLVPVISKRTTAEHIDRMVRGGVTLVVVSMLGAMARDGYAATLRQLDLMKPHVIRGALVPVLRARDVEQARRRGRPGVMLAIEGGDFLEGRLERLHEVSARGVRAIQLIHHDTNPLGDAVGSTRSYGGLSAFGRAVIREMNRARILVDLAGASLEATKNAAAGVTAPFVISHSAVGVTGVPRAITPEHARIVRDVRGVLGVFPVSPDGGGVARYADHIMRAVDVLGIDHVGVGTDMDGVPRELAIFDDYAAWPFLRETLYRSGLGSDEVDKILGGNALRVFREIRA